jgi:hypothetical protein
LHGKVHVIKGVCDNIPIRNTSFALIKPIEIKNGVATAFVDATAVFGVSSVKMILEEYREL